MLIVAYLANEFPSAVEPYVSEEIEELRRRGVQVITTSVRRPKASSRRSEVEIVLLPLTVVIATRALLLCVRRLKQVAPLVGRVAFHGRESLSQRVKALAHTFLGACYAAKLEELAVEHIHAHHGYFGSWIAMTAARLLGVGFSLTLHGSDLLLHGIYLDVKLENCAFCLTVSEYNRQYVLERYPEADRRKVMVARLGVQVPEIVSQWRTPNSEPFTILAVGRLHEVKDHAFLVRACARLRELDLGFECYIAGEGPERRRLEYLIQKYELENCVTLLGHVAREQMNSLYDRADVVVLTSRSEGIPLVLMEAMARGRVVLAPAITGIPELVIPGKTGFLYESASMDDFVDRLRFVYALVQSRDGVGEVRTREGAKFLDWIRHGARVQVRHNFNKGKNLESLVDLFLEHVAPQNESLPDENLILQQI
ncbi:MAG: glycosyltransferase family 4 protein [Candidatus Sulfotelmatobacter sp.]